MVIYSALSIGYKPLQMHKDHYKSPNPSNRTGQVVLTVRRTLPQQAHFMVYNCILCKQKRKVVFDIAWV